MDNEGLWKRVALGAAAGLVGTIVLQAIRTADQKWIPEGTPPMRDDPANFMVHKAKAALPRAVQERLPAKAETALTKLLPLGYGMTFGALYAGLRPAAKGALSEGVLLGLLSWAVGWLGWLPRTGLMPPVSQHTPKQIIRPAAEHAVFGLASVAGYRYLAQKLSHA